MKIVVLAGVILNMLAILFFFIGKIKLSKIFFTLSMGCLMSSFIF